MHYEFPDSRLLIFCKAPISGQVKTRLQPAMTPEQALAAHKQLARMTLERALQSCLCPLVLCCAPDSAHAFFQQCEKEYSLTLLQQRGHDLGERMHHALSEALTSCRHAVLIGCDCPSLTVDDLREVLVALQQDSDVAIGPAEDGGYVLIGLNAPHPDLFRDVTWGSDRVMFETLQRVALAGLKLHELRMQWDVDTMDDWIRYSMKY